MKSVRVQILYAAFLALLLMSGLSMLCYEAYGSDFGPDVVDSADGGTLNGGSDRTVNVCVEHPDYSLFVGCRPIEGPYAEPCSDSCPTRKGRFQETGSKQVCNDGGGYGDREMICCCHNR